MWFDVAALAILAWFGFTGFRRGAMVSFLRIFALVSAYASAVFVGPVFAPITAALFGLPQMIALAASGAAVFVCVGATLGAITFLAKRYDARRLAGGGRSLPDALLGALFGGAQGAAFALLVGFLAAWLEAGGEAGIEGIPASGDAVVARTTQSVVETAADLVLPSDDSASRMAIKLAVRPKETVRELTDLMESDEIAELQTDGEFWADLENGFIDDAMTRRTFIQVSYRKAMRERFANLGLVDPAGVDDPQIFQAEMRAMLEQLGPRIQSIKNDPELERLMEDREIVEAVHAGDVTALLANRKFVEAVDRLLAAPPDADGKRRASQ